MLKIIIENIIIFFTFRFSIFQSEYSEKWDRELNELLKTTQPKLGEKNSLDGNFYELYLGGKSIWIQNYPYAFGVEFFRDEKIRFGNGRPSKRTILKLKKIVDELIEKRKYEKKINLNNFKLLKNNL